MMNLSPKQSAKIIIDHVLDGIIIAQKNNFPDRVIDFIKNSPWYLFVYYFYKKQEEFDAKNINVEDFQYHGPNLFQKRRLILMMADAVEAASKSLKSPDIRSIQSLLRKIIDGKMEGRTI